VETIVYFSRNNKKSPFEVSIKLDGQIAYIDCNCELGLERKICRHKINAIRADRQKSHSSTTDNTIARLKMLFGTNSILRQHLEEQWQQLREFASANPNDEAAISQKRKALGEAFSNGFSNETSFINREAHGFNECGEMKNMSQSIRDTLVEACDNGEVIRIVYHGGSQPGTVRDISIITICGLDVRARDLAVGTTKNFNLAKIELADPSTTAPHYNPNHPPDVEPTGTIREVFDEMAGVLKSLGWHVEISDDAISLCRYFKNGRPRKASDIKLCYSEYVTDAFVDADGIFNEEKRRSTRPYRLTSRIDASAKTFKKISSAVSGFLIQAHAQAPVKLTLPQVAFDDNY
jgi:hypothetical protein